MRNVSTTLVLLLLAFVLQGAWAQSTINDQQQLNATTQAPNTGAEPTATGPAAGQASDFPPLSGLDEPSLEPNVAARSFLLYGAQASELADTNAGNSLRRNGTPIVGVTHLLGTAGLQRLWEHYQVGLDYVGGGAFYAGSVRDNSQMHELKFDARTTWRTGALTLRDTASYLPDGTFGGSFGAAGGLGGGGLGGISGAGLGGASGERFSFFGANTFGSLGTFPRINNLAVLDFQQLLSPRSAVTMAGGYKYLHFTESTGGLFIDSRSIFAQAGYNYSINRRNKVALVYGFQHFEFPSAAGATFVTHLAQLMYGHQISGRMDLLVGVGPQLTSLNSPQEGNTLRLSASGRASLRYKFPRTSLIMSYDRYNSASSGFFAGETTDLARFTVERPIRRRWTAAVHVGYSHHKRLQVASVGVNAGSYQAGLAGFRMSRTFSRSLSGFVLYNFNEVALDPSFCGSAATCNRTSIRHIVGVGLTWHPHAIRLD